MNDMASGDVMFAATGVTDGSMLRGIHLQGGFLSSETIVMRSATGTVRWIRAKHVRKLMED
jgi:fructose-1,6-bisphosphatase II / sedoheptulose-1,7-bisphosphatase